MNKTEIKIKILRAIALSCTDSKKYMSGFTEDEMKMAKEIIGEIKDDLFKKAMCLEISLKNKGNPIMRSYDERHGIICKIDKTYRTYRKWRYIVEFGDGLKKEIKLYPSIPKSRAPAVGDKVLVRTLLSKNNRSFPWDKSRIVVE